VGAGVGAGVCAGSGASPGEDAGEGGEGISATLVIAAEALPTPASSLNMLATPRDRISSTAGARMNLYAFRMVLLLDNHILDDYDFTKRSFYVAWKHALYFLCIEGCTAITA
jgi:hypothetical protein